MHKFSVSKDMKKKRINDDKKRRRRDMVVGKVVAHLCRTLIIKELKFSVEYDRVVTKVCDFTVKGANSMNYFSGDHSRTDERSDRCAQSLLLPKLGLKVAPCWWGLATGPPTSRCGHA
jgi:hypothetical protein